MIAFVDQNASLEFDHDRAVVFESGRPDLHDAHLRSRFRFTHRQLAYSMAAKSPLIGVTQAMWHGIFQIYALIPEGSLLRTARFIRLAVRMQLWIFRSP